MATGIIGKKLGMTQIFDESGNHIPVTVLEAGPCTVVDVRPPSGTDMPRWPSVSEGRT